MSDVFAELRDMIGVYAELEIKAKKYNGSSSICMKRKESRSREKPFIAYDLETTLIKEGTPELLYVTAFGPDTKLSLPIIGKNRLQHFCDILEAYFLLPERNNTRFIAWNGNAFDAYFVAKALLLSNRWILRPYLTRSKMLRGLKVIEKTDTKKKLQFEFLDGIAMTGMYGVKLEKFLNLFAPDYKKLKLDFALEEFDATKPEHVVYADRDSEGLYYGMKEVNRIVRELTGNDLQPTIGNVAIKYFQSQIPQGVKVWRPPDGIKDTLYSQLKRGGYCWAQQQYKGKIWKYDLNQAYAAAMRDSMLPAGRCTRTDTYQKNMCGVYHVKMSRAIRSTIPFYYRDINKNMGYFTLGDDVETWITSNEYDHLIADNWFIDVVDGWFWDEFFNMQDMVDNLERLRFTDPSGPSGPLGTMVKYIGNNAYGKTLEQLEGIELVFAQECPTDFIAYMPEIEGMDNVFCRFREPLKRAYHQPQIGIFITAHVRMVVREAALKEHKAFLYADTDCVVYSKEIFHLSIDSRKYGAWKKEVDGKNYVIIGKKVYYGDNDNKHAKGLNIKELTEVDFYLWLEGQPPKQQQIHKQNFVKYIGGEKMFNPMERRGTDVNLTQQCRLVGNRFVPLSPKVLDKIIKSAA